MPNRTVELAEARLPMALSSLRTPPERLYLNGEMPPGPLVAVVGTRSPTAEALAFTRELVRALVAARFAVASGGAVGIDAQAHQAALEAGGRTLVVAPAGWEAPYPAEHRSLFESVVVAGGGYLSAAAPHRSATQPAFFLRNELLVALSCALVLVQAPPRSGARNAARHARLLARPVFAVPSCPWVPQGLGCNVEIGLGAFPLSSPRDLLRGLARRGHVGLALAQSSPNADTSEQTWLQPELPGIQCAANAAPGSASAALVEFVSPRIAPRSGWVQALERLLARRPYALPELARCLRVRPADLSSELLRLSLLGRVRRQASGEWCAASS